MDSQSLRTASTYLNNLLLARGHLRNGEPIDFVKPSKESRAQIINLVHDLILRGDRDKERGEQMAFALTKLRSDDGRKTNEIERLTAKHDEAARGVVQAQAAERNAKEELKKVERTLRGLQEQSARMKTTLAQVKTQCANDVRKRDVELARLKTHLQGQQRGGRTGVTAPSISITNGGRKVAFDVRRHDIGDPEYSLKQETTTFLTELSQSLSDENDGLIGLIRTATGTVRELLGLPANSHDPTDSAMGSRASSDDANIKDHDNGMIHALPTSFETLATDMEQSLSHLKQILTNPNFVPLEEVEIRDEEIVRLREGWERMEQRWRDVLLMMEGWLRRLTTGETINIDDLRRGMGLVSPQRGHDQLLPRKVEGVRHSQSLDEDDTIDTQMVNAQEDDHESEGEMSIVPEVKTRQRSDTSGTKRKRDVLEPPEFFDLRPSGTSRQKASSALQSPSQPMSEANLEEEEDAVLAVPGEDESEQLDGPRMTVEEKLSAAAQEAAAARANRHQNKASRYGSLGMNSASDGTSEEVHHEEDTLGRLLSPARKTNIRGRARRRKSTLSRDELAELLLNAGDEED